MRWAVIIALVIGVWLSYSLSSTAAIGFLTLFALMALMYLAEGINRLRRDVLEELNDIKKLLPSPVQYSWGPGEPDEDPLTRYWRSERPDEEEYLSGAPELELESKPAYKEWVFENRPWDKELLASVKDVVKPGKHYSENIDAIWGKINAASTEAVSLPEKADKDIEFSAVREYLLRAKEESSVVYGGDEDREKHYDALLDGFMNILEKKPKKLSSVLEARKEFDKAIARWPFIWQDVVRANAVRDVRTATNDFVAAALPQGNKFEALLEEQSKMFRVICDLARKVADEPDDTFPQRMLGIIQRRAWLSMKLKGSASTSRTNGYK
jgi:hypothetical protein